jgi:hypothetical protein
MTKFVPLLLLVVAACACDAFWEGPTLPGGAKNVAYTVLSQQGPPAENLGIAILADTSIAGLRATIAQRARLADCHAYAGSSDACWEKIADAPGHLYVALAPPNVCNQSVRETAALSGRTLYFIEWFGRPQGPCGDAEAQPHLRLLSFNRSDLPPSGRLTVDLQFQNAGTTTDYKTEVTLP